MSHIKKYWPFDNNHKGLIVMWHVVSHYITNREGTVSGLTDCSIVHIDLHMKDQHWTISVMYTMWYTYMSLCESLASCNDWTMMTMTLATTTTTTLLEDTMKQ
jgi:hypothetical protein